MRSARVAAVVLAVLTSACATNGAGNVDVAAPPDGPSSPPPGQPVTGPDARARQVYDAVLRRYLSSEDPRGGGNAARSSVVYVVDDATSSAGNPETALSSDKGQPIPTAVQRAVTKDLAGLARVRWVDRRDDVIVQPRGCAHVRGSGVVITLAPVPRKGDRVEVGVGGFAACLAGSWLTYVVQTDGTTGWKVSGTTGPIAMS